MQSDQYKCIYVIQLFKKKFVAWLDRSIPPQKPTNKYKFMYLRKTSDTKNIMMRIIHRKRTSSGAARKQFTDIRG